MALSDEQADILGGPIMQRPDSSLFASLSPYYFVLRMVVLLGLAVLAWNMLVRGLEHIKRRRELASRKAMRRKHGIPDSDCRPFAVAYAAARRARTEREAQEQNKTTNQLSDHLLPAIDQRTYAQKDAHGLRRRVPESTAPLRDQYLPTRPVILRESRHPDVTSLNFADRYNPNPRPREIVQEQSPIRKPTARRASRKNLVLDARTHEESKKRSLADEGDIEHDTAKKSRIGGDEVIDGNEQADWYAQYTDLETRRLYSASPDRQVVGSYVDSDGQKDFGGADQSQDEDPEPADEAMEGIDEDEVTELRSMARGKKRDRAEAGSAFGGDEEEDILSGKAMHHRKRRTISRKQSGLAMRGHKRDRGFETPESDGESTETYPSYGKHLSKKKKGKKSASVETSEVSVEDPRVSGDPLCGGRKIGEEWKSDGIQYKVGDKGERLRLALVKKARNRYPMPQDSQHPDRSSALQIYVETWMTEAQYKEAEERHDLAWQDPPGGSSGSKTPDIPASPSKTGKNLLWDSVTGSPARRTFRQAISTAGNRVNPFEQQHSYPALGRRVASSSTMVLPALPFVADSPVRPGFRGFSKWEKQDREAEAMARIRAKLEQQKKVQMPNTSELPASATAPELVCKQPVPAITITPASSVPVSGKLDDNTSQSKPTISTFTFAPAASSNDSNKAPISNTVPSATPPAAPSLFPNSSTATPSSTAFSFAKPQISTSQATSTTTPSSIPNFFGKTSSAPSSSTSGTVTQTQPLSNDSAPKPSLPSFGKPDTQSSTSASVPTAPSPFSTVPSSSSSPSTLTFGSTHAPPKTNAPASEVTKPTAPTFQFSVPSSTTAASSAPMTSSTLPAPKFSFGTPSTTSSAFATSSSSSAPQQKPTSFEFEQTSTVSTQNATAAATEFKKPDPSPSIFGSTSKDQTPKPAPFGGASVFGDLTFTPSSAPGTILGKSPTAGADASASLPKPISTSGSTATSNNLASTTPAGSPASGAAPTHAFSFGVNSGPSAAEASKPTSLFGTEPSKAAPAFGGSAVGSKPMFTFGSTPQSSQPASALSGDNAKPASSSSPSIAFGGSTNGLKPTSVFGGTESSKSPFSFGATAETSKPTFTFSGTAENKPASMFGGTGEGSKPASFAVTSADTSKPSPFGSAGAAQPPITFPNVSFGSSSSSSTFSFGKKDDASTSSASVSAKPASPFAFGGASSATGLNFGQTPNPSSSGDQNQSVFGKTANATPSAFGFNAPSSSSNAFSFNKPATQNQKQEQ